MTDLHIPPLDASPRWVVQVTLATERPISAAAFEDIADHAEKELDATVATRADGPGIVITADVGPDELAHAATDALRITHTVIAGTAGLVDLVDLRVCTPEVYEADALRPDTPELLAATDVAEVLGVSRQRVHQLAERRDFPAPYVRLGSGPVWTRPAIEAFNQSWTRKPGRPAKAS